MKYINKKYIFAGGAALILLIAVLLCIGSSSCGNSKYDKNFSYAETAFLEKDYEAAIESLEKAINAEATEEAYLLMAEAYNASGDLDMAIQVLYIGYSKTGSDAVAELLERFKDEKNGGTEPAVSMYTTTIDIGDKSIELNTKSLVLVEMSLSDSDIIGLKNLTKLESLSLSDNDLTDISPLSPLTGLTFLQISDNLVSDISAISHLTKLKTLYIDGNPITDFTPLYKLTNLKTLSMKRIEITDTQLAELELALPNCSIYSDEAIKDAVEIELGGEIFMSDITNLALQSLNITDISQLSQCVLLEQLELMDNDINDISPLIDLQELQILNISSNSIDDLRPLMSLSDLQSLNAAHNNISDITVVSYLPALTSLYLSGNELSSTKPLADCTKLESLYLSDCGLSDDDLDNLKMLSNLKILDICENTELTGNKVDELKETLPNCEILADELRYTAKLGKYSFTSDENSIMLISSGVSDLSGLDKFTELKTLKLTNNSVSDLSPLSELQKLETIDLYANDISDLSPLSGKASITVLDLDKNNISDISPLTGCTGLRELYLGGNNISSIVSLAGCTALEVLSLENNSITDVSALAELYKLTELDLDNNNIQEISCLASLENLEILYLRGNPELPVEDIAELKELLPDCNIVSDYDMDNFRAAREKDKN